MQRPNRRTEFEERVVEGEMVVMDKESEQIHQLNQTASFIWQRCDGEHDRQQIAEELAEAFDVDAETAQQDVADTLEKLEEIGLLLS
jgi:PqqD family protein of HPr-rel-A system